MAAGYGLEALGMSVQSVGEPVKMVANHSGDKDSLYHNDGAGQFTKIADGPVVANSTGYSYGACWGDYDNDGRLDLFVTAAGPNKTNFLYHNEGNGIFTIAAGFAASQDGGSYGCAWVDFDNDGYLDLFVANDNSGTAPCFLYRNKGDGTFTPNHKFSS